MPKKEKLLIDKTPPGVTSVKEIFQKCRQLQPGETLPSRYALADRAGQRMQTPGKGTDASLSDSAFAFGLDTESMFVARETRERAAGSQSAGTMTYLELSGLVRETGASGFLTLAEPVPEKKIFTMSEESALDRKHREVRESANEYLARVREKMKDRAFRRILGEKFSELGLTERLQELAPGRSDDKAERGLMLMQGKTIPLDEHPATKEEMDKALVQTLTVRLLHKTQPLSVGDYTTVLGKPQVEALAAIIDEVEHFEQRESPFKTELQDRKIELVRLEVTSWRERAGEKYFIVVPLTTLRVPKKERA